MANIRYNYIRSATANIRYQNNRTTSWLAKCVIRLRSEDGEYSEIRCSLRDSTWWTTSLGCRIILTPLSAGLRGNL